MDWSKILYVGLGAGIGSGLGSIIALGFNKGIKNKKYHSSIVAAFSVILMFAGTLLAKSLYANMRLPRIGSSMETVLLESSPIYVEMQKYEPEYFNKIIDKLDKSVRNGSDEASIINEGRAILIELLADKAKYADAETLTATMEIARQNYLDFKTNKPYLCVLMVNQRGMGDIGPYISAASNELEQEYTLNIIRLPRQEIKVVDVEMAKKSEASTTAEFMKTIKPGDTLDVPEDSPKEKLERVCDLGVAMMDAILALPEPERSNYIRSTFGQ